MEIQQHKIKGYGMQEYIIYKCNDCGKHFILLGEEADHEGYITCPRHGKHKSISVIGACDDLKECAKHMSRHDTYKKKGSTTVQTRWG